MGAQPASTFSSLFYFRDNSLSSRGSFDSTTVTRFHARLSLLRFSLSRESFSCGGCHIVKETCTNHQDIFFGFTTFARFLVVGKSDVGL